MADGNDSARGSGLCYATLQGLLNSGGEDVLLDPPAPPDFNIGATVTFLGPRRWNSICTTASSLRENSFLVKSPTFNIKVMGGKGGNVSVHRHRRTN